MTEEKPCSACRALINAPTTVEPHARLRDDRKFRMFLDFNTETYHCEACGMKWKRLTTMPRRTATWTVTE